jgi:hypothetical protein
LARYRLKNGRRYQYVDCIDISTPGISLSAELEIEQEDVAAEDEVAPAAKQ